MKRKNLVNGSFIAVLMLLSVVLKGQVYDYNRIIPPSPNAASLGIYGNINVGYYTGTASTDIPIYSIKTGNHTLNINLSYSSTGLKVSQDASWVGLGWNLNAGGVITRSIRGKDDFKFGYYNDDQALPTSPGFEYDYTYLSEYQKEIDRLYFKKLYEGTWDGDPDIFYYNFGGYSGKFVIDKEINGGECLVFHRNNLKFQLSDPSVSNNWLITDPNGYKYYFGTYEQTQNYSATLKSAGTTLVINESNYDYGLNLNYYSPDPNNSNTAWYLDSIVAPTGESIVFEYESGQAYSISLASKAYKRYDVTYIQHTESVPEANHFPGLPKGIYDYFSVSKQVVRDVYLKKITFKNGYLLFHTSDRDDIQSLSSQKPKKVHGINVYSSDNSLVKRIDFHQTYFNAGSPGFEEKRLKLDSVSFYGTGSKIYSYRCSYFDPQGLPSKYSKSQDYWGYYNGTSYDQSLLIPVTIQRPHGAYESLPGGNRNPTENADDLKKGILTSITYPTGGRTEFEYELNRYSNVDEPYRWGGESVFARSGIPNSNLTANFTLAERVNVDLVLAIPSGPPENPSTACAYLKQGTNIIRTFYGTDGHVNVSLEAGTYTIEVVELPEKMIFFSADWPVKIYDVIDKPAGGLRVKKTANYDPTQPTIVKKYIYKVADSANSASSGILISKVRLSKSNAAIPFFYCWYRPCGPTDCLSWGYYSWLYNLRTSYSNIPLGFFSDGNPIGYTRVVELTGENGEGGSTEYNFLCQEHANTDDYIPFIPSRSYNTNGQLHDVIIKNQAGNTVKRTSFEYVKKESYNIKGIKLFRADETYHPFDGPPSCHGSLNTLQPIAAWAPLIRFYDNSSEWWVQSEIREYIYDANNTVTTTRKLFYDNNKHKRVTREEQIGSSDGSDLVIQYKYPQDFESSLPSNPSDNDGIALKDLIGRHIISPVIEKQVLRKRGTVSTLVSGELTRYKLFNSVAMPHKLYKLEANTPLTGTTQATYVPNVGFSHNINFKPAVTFDLYDGSGNLLQYHKENDVYKSFVWGYNNCYPVAEITSSTLTYDNAIAGRNLSIIQNPSSDQSLRTELNFIRQNNPSAIVTTYTYKPLIGITSTCDAGDHITYYEYDHFGRLQHIRDRDNNILKTFDYKYQAQ